MGFHVLKPHFLKWALALSCGMGSYNFSLSLDVTVFSSWEVAPFFFFFQIRDMKCMWRPIRYLSAEHIQSASIGGFYLWSQDHLSVHIIMLKAQTAFLEACHSPLKISGLFSLASGSLTGSPGFHMLHMVLPTFPIHRPDMTMLLILASSWESWPLGEAVRRLAARMSHFLSTCNRSVLLLKGHYLCL